MTATENQDVNRASLLEKAKEASHSPGVYLMKDVGGLVLYIGKAKNLRNRLVTYFQGSVHEIPRIEMLVARISRFDVILTDTETEALILECTLIKKHKPKFNVRLKDDKTYPYLKIQLGDSFPRLEYTRRIKREGARYFGPFPSAWSVRQVSQILNETFQLRTCSDNTFRHRSRPCILYQMGKCSGSCVGQVSREEYSETMGEVVKVLEGKSDRLTVELRRGMEDAAANEEYELAAEYRDQLRNLEMVTSVQGVYEVGVDRDRDVAALGRNDADAHGVIMQIRGGRLVSVKHFHLQNADPYLTTSELLFDFLAQYYVAAESEEVEEMKYTKPRHVLVPEAPTEPELIESAVGIPVMVSTSEVDEQLLRVARANVDHALEQSARKAEGHGIQALEEVQEKLHLDHLPHRIECYDISNIHGQDAVGSRVVFVDGAPDKNLYRRYKIRTVEGANDFAMMKEVLGRRFENGEEDLPDLVVVDGGKGQLAQAVAILDELSVQGVAVVGLAKARVERDFQATEVASSMERVFIPNRKNPVPLLPHTAAYKLLTHVRDEAHRFAINYHRHLRDKRSLRTHES